MTNSGKQARVREMVALPEWVRALAYQLWAWECSQNTTKVAALLNDGTYTDNGGFVPDDAMAAIVDEDTGEVTYANPTVRVTRQAVDGWKHREGWEDRRITELREIAPAIHAKVAGNLMAGSLQAEQFITDLAAGRTPMPKDANEAKYLTERLKASMDLLSRTGHLPHSRPKDDTALPGPRVDHKHQIAGKSTDELLALVQGSLARKSNVIGDDIGDSIIDVSNEPVIEAASPSTHP